MQYKINDLILGPGLIVDAKAIVSLLFQNHFDLSCVRAACGY